MVKSETSGSGTDEIYKPSLAYYENMMFLADTEDTRDMSGTDIAVSTYLLTYLKLHGTGLSI